MNNGKLYRTLSMIFFLVVPFFSNLSCSNSGSGAGTDQQVLGAEFAYREWPNQSTTETSSSEISSKVLVTDLDGERPMENIFISRLPNSSEPKSNTLRITQDILFEEVINYKSERVALLHDSIPFAFDLDSDGTQELLFVSYERDRVYAFQFKNKLKYLFVRWTANLPEVLDEDFDRRLSPIELKDEIFIKVGPFALREKNRRKVSVIDLRDLDSDIDDESEDEDE